MHVVHLPANTQRIEDVIRAAQGSGDAVLVLWGTFCQLGNELGGQGQATSWLRELATTTGRPIAFSAPSCDSACEAHIFTPPDWSEDRALGWVGGFHVEVEAMLGPATVLHERSDGSRVRLD